MTKEEIEQAAREYSTGKSSSDVFREAHETDFIAGANWALQSENERLKAEREWISVEDRLPNNDKDVLIAFSNGDVEHDWYDKDFSHWDKFRYDRRHITHWMPLPQHPKQ